MIQSDQIDLTCCTDSLLIFSSNSVACQSQSEFPRIGSSPLWDRERVGKLKGKLPPSHFQTLQLSELRPCSPSCWLYCCPNSVSWNTCSPSASPAAQKVGAHKTNRIGSTRSRRRREELGEADLPRSVRLLADPQAGAACKADPHLLDRSRRPTLSVKHILLGNFLGRSTW